MTAQTHTGPSQPLQSVTNTGENNENARVLEALPEEMPGGADLADLQRLEHQLLELQAQPPGEDMANVLRALGFVNCKLGYLEEAQKHLHESLRVWKSLCGIVTALELLSLCSNLDV